MKRGSRFEGGRRNEIHIFDERFLEVGAPSCVSFEEFYFTKMNPGARRIGRFVCIMEKYK